MFSGEQLSAALKAAMKAKDVKQGDIATAFGISQPSVSEWLKHGRVHKKHISKLVEYFSDQVGPEHWGLPFSKDEFDLVLAFRAFPPQLAADLLARAKAAAAEFKAAAGRAGDILPGPVPSLVQEARKRHGNTPADQEDIALPTKPAAKTQR